jgi:hypothetical protein
MNVAVVKEDNVVAVDGEGLNFDFDLPTNIWAIQWDGTEGEVEFNDGTPNETITSFLDYQYLVDAYNIEKQRLADEEAQAAIDAEAAITYAEKRVAEYPPMEDYLDGIVKGDTAQVDKYIADCLAVKDKYPKE